MGSSIHYIGSIAQGSHALICVGVSHYYDFEEVLIRYILESVTTLDAFITVREDVSLNSSLICLEELTNLFTLSKKTLISYVH